MARRELLWWYWLATVGLLAVGLLGDPRGLFAATALTGIQLAHLGIRERSLLSFPLQVRWAYLGLLVLGLWPPLAFIHWVQLLGTSALLVFDYCLLARLLSLLPWNRSEPLTLGLLRRRIFAPPISGSIACKTK